MEPKTPKCPACGSENWIADAKFSSHGAENVHIVVTGKRRETWKDDAFAQSGVVGTVCADCGHVSLWASDLPALRNAAAKINN